jgi:transposase InsO family protein
MGYKLDNHTRTSLYTDALSMAIKNRKYPEQKLIHHSDNGFLYCNSKYKEFTKINGITVSMIELYAPYENAIAERINRKLQLNMNTN